MRKRQFPNTLYWNSRRKPNPISLNCPLGKPITQKQYDLLVRLGVAKQELQLMNRFMASKKIDALLQK